MAHYSIRIERNKNISKFTDKDWKEVEQDAVKGMFDLIKKHMIATQMSEETSSLTVIEYDLQVDTPRIYSDKANRKQISTDNL